MKESLIFLDLRLSFLDNFSISMWIWNDWERLVLFLLITQNRRTSASVVFAFVYIKTTNLVGFSFDF